MKILIVIKKILPVKRYGGTERIMWWLAKQYNLMGHNVTFLSLKGTSCPFAKVIEYNNNKTLNEQIPESIDIVHLNSTPKEKIKKPYLISIRGNAHKGEKFQLNTAFLSENHAKRHNAKCFVYNGLDIDDYGKPDFNIKRKHLLFLAKASWKVKNLKGAIDIATKSKNHLAVAGGSRLNLKMGWRFTPNLNVSFHGLVGGEKKNRILNQSKALLFPVLWHEPFGIAIIESLYFGMPVFGTKYGSLPEIVSKEVGYLSNTKSELIEAIQNIDKYNRKKCYEYVCDNFNSQIMAKNYLKLYEKILNKEKLNELEPFSNNDYSKKLLTLNE